MLPGTATAIIVAVVNFDPLMPQDPFADDPNDPAALFDTEEPMPPLSDEDRRHILEDMELVAQFLNSFNLFHLRYCVRVGH